MTTPPLNNLNTGKRMRPPTRYERERMGYGPRRVAMPPLFDPNKDRDKQLAEYRKECGADDGAE
jgi:hypothetical protein